MCLCSTQFCYLCAAPWKTCECPQWDENRLVRAAEARVQAEAPRVRPAPALVERMVEQLRVNHECAHRSWCYRPGGGQCQSCYNHLRGYLLVRLLSSLGSSCADSRPVETALPRLPDDCLRPVPAQPSVASPSLPSLSCHAIDHVVQSLWLLGGLSGEDGKGEVRAAKLVLSQRLLFVALTACCACSKGFTRRTLFAES